ncbi:MAG TPA: AraC family transcriptional regulator [Telluria sp.]|nr:AraC family transcriptional regulator [Telluria sp.]
MTYESAPALSVRTYGPAHDCHTHKHFQVLWGLEGILELEIEGAGTRLDAGAGIVIAPNERHAFESRTGSRCLVLDSVDEAWAARLRRPQHVQATGHLAHFLASSLNAALPVSLEYGAYLLAQSWGETQAPRRARREIDWPLLTAWVKARLAQPLTARQLAALVNLSESQFRARCLQVTGCAPMQWVRRLRLEHAAALRARGMSVAQAARRAGYESPAALTAAARRQDR